MLNYITGAEEVPPTGYGILSSLPTLKFDHMQPMPMASICAIELTLPTKYFDKPFSAFKDVMDTPLLCHGGFGLV